MTQAVEDGATRTVYYESRVIHLKLDEDVLHRIDAEYDLVAESAEPCSEEQERTRSDGKHSRWDRTDYSSSFR